MPSTYLLVSQALQTTWQGARTQQAWQ
jgi:hypothetical protein